MPSSPHDPVSAPTPVVLVHGLRVSGETLHRLAAGVRGRPVAHPDLPGHGHRRDEKFTMSGAVDAVVAEIEKFRRPAVVAGMSMGGYVSMAVAGRHPDLVAGLVPMCSTAQPSRMLAAPFQAFGAATSWLPEEAAAISRWLTRVAVGEQVAADMEIGGLALSSIRDVVGEVREFDALTEVHHYPGPIEYINGAWDQFRMHEARFVGVSDHARLSVLPRATHLFPLIQPVRTGRMISEFAAAIDSGELGRSELGRSELDADAAVGGPVTRTAPTLPR